MAWTSMLGAGPEPVRLERRHEEIVREHFNLEHVSSASWYFF